MTRQGLKAVKDVYVANYYIDDPELPEVIWSVYIAANRPGVPLWLRVKGAPSFTKTTFTAPLTGLPMTVPVSNLTSSTLVSGFKGAVPLLQTLDGKVMIVNDASAIQSQHVDKRGVIYAQMRDAYDGTWAHWFGGEVASVKGKGRFGAIWACTREFDSDRAFTQRLGERFLDVCVRNENRKEKGTVALANTMNADAIKKAVAFATEPFIQDIWDNPVSIDPLTPDQGERLVALADFVSKATTPIVRDGRTKAVLQIPDAGGPMRLVQQLKRLGDALAEIRGVTSIRTEEMETVRRVALDGVLKERMRVMEVLKAKPSIQNVDVARELRLHHALTARMLEDLNLLGLVDETEIVFGARPKTVYRLSPDAEGILR